MKNNPSEADKQKAAQSGAGLKVAGSGPADKNQDEGIGVMLSMDKDETAQKLERDAEAAAKRQQNALPAWHLKSTISGDLTALGIIESTRTESASAVLPSSSSSSLALNSNDHALRGLGTVGSVRADPVPFAVVEDVKPVVNHEYDCELIDFMA